MRSLLFIATALPLVHASAAVAETKVSSARTAPVSTSSAAGGARDDVTIEKAGSIKLGQAGVAVTIDSANKVKNDGEIAFEDKNDSTGVLLTPGVQGSLENNGTIRLVENYTPTDSDKDGDLDGSFATGSNRFGVRLGTGGAFTGNIVNGATGAISIEGNDSAGILLQSHLQGSLTNAGTIGVTGDRSVGISATSVSGDVKLTGAVTAVGAEATAVSLGDIGGALHIQNTISATGYRSTERLADAARAKLDADDLRQGGSAVRVAGSVGGGILLDRPPTDTNADDKDEDKDGTPDADERAANLTVYGSAPALDIGGAAATTIGRAGTGDNAYGLVVKGQVRGFGVNDGVSATAIRIGQAGGGTTTIDGGINVADGTVSASAYGAAASAIVLNGGARADELKNSGQISAAVASDGAHNATAVLIESGATMRTLRNSGTLSATLTGEAGDAAAIVDRSGTLSLIENSGRITASISPTDDANDKDDTDTDPANEVVTGRAVAADLRANGTGAILRQSKASANAAEPAMAGDVLFGSGNDRVELLAGTYSGTLSFGAGADSLLIDGGAAATARLLDGDNQLTVDVRKGSLTVTNGSAVRLNALSVGAEGTIAVAIDPSASTSTRFEVANTASIATGARIELTMTSLLRETREYEILRAGTLSVGNASTMLAGAPYLYTASLRQDAAAGVLYVDVRTKTASELGLNRSGAQGYAAVYDRLDRDKRIEAAFLGAQTREQFLGLYNQMLPDHSGASLMSAAAISSAVTSAIKQPLKVPQDGDYGLAVWGQEILFDISRDADDAAGFKSQGIGFAAGVERVTGNHAFGISASYVATDYKDRWAAADEQTSMQFAEAGLYWRTERGRFKANARGGLGYVWFNGERRLLSEANQLDLTASAKWQGWLADAHAGASYDLGSGWFVARPEVSVNYLYLKEKGYREAGGGAGFDLEVDSRKGQMLTGTAALAIGARFGKDFRWGPEVKAGWRQRLSGEAGRTTARFLSGGSDFILSPEDLPDGEKMVQVAFHGQTDELSFAIEAGTAFDGAYEQYDLRAVARFAF